VRTTHCFFSEAAASSVGHAGDREQSTGRVASCLHVEKASRRDLIVMGGHTGPEYEFAVDAIQVN
jgi:hypothetical protein